MDWETWFRIHRRELYANSRWELQFAQSVLKRVPELDFDHVRTQTELTDNEGTRRRIDFTIQDGDHVRIAIEVDGWDKTGTGSGMTREEHTEWLRRERAITTRGWVLLRFSNADVRRQPERCAEELEAAIRDARRVAAVAATASHTGARSQGTVAHDVESESSANGSPLRPSLHRPRRWLGSRFLIVAAIGVATVAIAAMLLKGGRPEQNLTGPPCTPCIEWDQAHNHVGELVTVHGEVAGHRYLQTSDGRPSFVALGNEYPSENRFDVIIWEEVRAEMAAAPAALLPRGSQACVRGVVKLYEGTPEIVLGAANEIGTCDDLG